MKITVQVRMRVSDEDARVLRDTLERVNEAANWLSHRAFEAGSSFHRYDLQKLAYREMRERFGLSADVTIRVIAKVADAYKIDRQVERCFRPTAGQPYNDRIMRFGRDFAWVNLWTTEGRKRIPLALGDHQRVLLSNRKREVDLLFVRGKWMLGVVCDMPEPEPQKVDAVLGVDLGIVNLAVDSDGTHYSGTELEERRRIFVHRRRNLQWKGTRSAKRKLRKIAGKQARFQRHTNHVISRRIVDTAQRTARAIALEHLKGVHRRVTAIRRNQRERHSNWGYAQLRDFIEYKARLVGVAVIVVEPNETSSTCPECGHADRRNRNNSQPGNGFRCVRCGHAGPADDIAARNIRARAAVNLPMVASGGRF